MFNMFHHKSDKLEEQLHEQYAVNNNSKTSSLIAILAALMVAFTGYGYVLYNYLLPSQCCSLFTKNSLLICVSIAVIEVITLLYILSVYLGTDQRLEQFIAFSIRIKHYDDKRKYREYNLVYPKCYHPFNKTFCNFVQGINNVLSNALIFGLSFIICATLAFCNEARSNEVFHISWSVSLLYMLYYRMQSYQKYLKRESEYKSAYAASDNQIIRKILKEERTCCILEKAKSICKHIDCVIFPLLIMGLSICFFCIFQCRDVSLPILTVMSGVFFFAGLYATLILVNSDK